MINGINLSALHGYQNLIKEQHDQAISSYAITAEWLGGVKTRISTDNQYVGLTAIAKDFSFEIDEPMELLGSNSMPTPQDYLFGGLAGCMIVGFVVSASELGIKLESLKLKIKGSLDLRGFLNIDPNTSIGFEKIEFIFQVKGSGTQQDYDKIVQHVQQFSPNYRTITDRVVLSINRDI